MWALITLAAACIVLVSALAETGGLSFTHPMFKDRTP